MAMFLLEKVVQMVKIISASRNVIKTQKNAI